MSTLYVLSRAAGLAAILFTSISVGADDPDAPIFSLAGFGTGGVVHSNESWADFTASPLQPTGAGYTHAWSASVDSLIGGQVTAIFTPRLSAVVQVIAQQNYNNTYWPHVEWADIKYQVTSDFSIRVGRTVLPSFLVSDAREVGFVNPWVRPPVELYSLVPITDSNGVDASYGIHTGGVSQTLVGSFGNTGTQIPQLGSAISQHHWLIADTLDYGAATFHIAYQQTYLSIPQLDATLDNFRQFGPQGEALDAKYDPDHKRLTIASVGAMYDPGQWFVMSEWGSVNFHSAVGVRTAWYVSGGYRLAKVTPYVTYAQAKADNLSDPGLTLSALPLSLQAPAARLNAALNVILSSKPVEKTISIGARWDFLTNTDLKIQFDRKFVGAGSAGGLISTQPGFQLGSDFSVFSATIDFVL